ncbi:NADH-quinone oxidoreductase subunit C [Planctomicrobium sp. SH664]|uniref:NADH-quinone oxidoreductase subunit C n=1 Tax=Planctomicrobium sp. SH664 TaxID=3448125 RepID=UPI003F5C68E7
MTIQEICSVLLEKFGEQVITGIKTEAKDPWIEVAPASVAEVATFLKHDPRLRFDSLCDLTGVDYLETDPKLAPKFPYQPHLEVVYHLYSLSLKHRLTMKALLPRWLNDQPGQLPEIPSVSGVWAIADWHEREAFDLVGIRFLNHPNLVRILCVDDWVGHPLRKDYEFPLEYHGMRGK